MLCTLFYCYYYCDDTHAKLSRFLTELVVSSKTNDFGYPKNVGAFFFFFFIHNASVLLCFITASYVTACKRDSEHLPQCITNAWEALRPYVGEGMVFRSLFVNDTGKGMLAGNQLERALFFTFITSIRTFENQFE